MLPISNFNFVKIKTMSMHIIHILFCQNNSICMIYKNQCIKTLSPKMTILKRRMVRKILTSITYAYY